jgi:hypothetical protein
MTDYHPTNEDFYPKLRQGESLIENSNSGKTRKERDKQSRRFKRIRERSIADRDKKVK